MAERKNTVKNQYERLCSVYPKMRDFAYDSSLADFIERGEIRLPPDTEPWLVPRWQTIGETYAEAAFRVFGKIRERRDVRNYLQRGGINERPDFLRLGVCQTEKSQTAWTRLAQNQRGHEILIVPIGLAGCKDDYISVSDEDTELDQDMFGLGVFDLGITSLTNADPWQYPFHNGAVSTGDRLDRSREPGISISYGLEHSRLMPCSLTKIPGNNYPIGHVLQPLERAAASNRKPMERQRQKRGQQISVLCPECDGLNFLQFKYRDDFWAFKCIGCNHTLIQCPYCKKYDAQDHVQRFESPRIECPDCHNTAREKLKCPECEKDNFSAFWLHNKFRAFKCNDCCHVLIQCPRCKFNNAKDWSHSEKYVIVCEDYSGRAYCGEQTREAKTKNCR